MEYWGYRPYLDPRGRDFSGVSMAKKTFYTNGLIMGWGRLVLMI